MKVTFDESPTKDGSLNPCSDEAELKSALEFL